jgi:NAD(P)-dependent dehydrogenase (short-subunit alcohol dehydrogenase family)
MTCAVVFGAGGGIGGALVDRLAACGRYAHIHAGSRRPLPPRPQQVSFLYDLTDESSIINACSILGTPPDLVLVASGLLHDQSGAVMPEKTLRAIQPEAMARMFAVNTIGPALIAKHWLPRLPKDRRAVFAVLSARVGSIGDNRLGGWHGYRASKAALNMLIANFAIEMRRTHPLAVIVALHPGTVATGLSRPFQSGVAPGQLFSPETAAAHLLDVIDRLTPKDSGGFFAWDGTRIRW